MWLLARGAAQPATPGAATTQPDVPGDGAPQPAMHGGGPAQPAMSSGGAVRLFTQGHLQEAANSRQIVGCDVAKAALQTLLHHHHGDTLPVLLTSLMALLFTGFHGWHTSRVLVTSSEMACARCTSSAGSRTVPQRPCPARATTCAAHWCLGPCDAQSHAGRRALGFTGKPFG